jgi:hypothetical protein
MDKVTFQNRISQIGTCEDEATRRELLSQLQEDMNVDFDRMTELETTNNQLTSDNESLRSANMKLFLRIGDHKAQDNGSLDDGEPKEKREFKNLFNEKGGIK